MKTFKEFILLSEADAPVAGAPPMPAAGAPPAAGPPSIPSTGGADLGAPLSAGGPAASPPPDIGGGPSPLDVGMAGAAGGLGGATPAQTSTQVDVIDVWQLLKNKFYPTKSQKS